MATVFALNKDTCDYLATRWHDQILDLKSVYYDTLWHKVQFVVLEELVDQKSPLVTLGRLGLFSLPIQSIIVTLWPVENVRLNYDRAETELFISRVVWGERVLRIVGMNGSVELIGEAMQLSMEPLSGAPKAGRVLDLGLFELSWPSRKAWRKKSDTGE